jgi:riboflavin synthase
MFTGIVEELGEVVAFDGLEDSARVTVRGRLVTTGASAGDSIAVNGVCLTVTVASAGAFTADVTRETLNLSCIGALVPGDRVNLERPVRPQGRFGGHIVQGHTDGTGTILSRRQTPNWDVIRVAVPPDHSRYVVRKGSVAIDGISLTVSAVSTDGEQSWIEVSLIPETL